MTRYIYAPGCALMAYKPHLGQRLKEAAEQIYGPMEMLLTCCFNRPALESGTCIVTPCSTCNNNYRKLHPEVSTSFLLHTLAQSPDFPFPDYGGAEMSIQDTCAGRTDPLYLESVRTLLRRMNITLVEAEKSGAKGRCCGQTLYGKVPIEKVESYMKQRAGEMPREDVVVYCASCIQSMATGGRRPRYIIDLLFGETTDTHGGDITAWNRRLMDFRNSH